MRRFGLLIARIILLLVMGVFAADVALQRPSLDSFLFALALAVGLTPELLPAIVTVNLSRGARALASHGVLVRRLPAIQNLGSMTVLCTDKTGTLTEGRLTLVRSIGSGWRGRPRRGVGGVAQQPLRDRFHEPARRGHPGRGAGPGRRGGLRQGRRAALRLPAPLSQRRPDPPGRVGRAHLQGRARGGPGPLDAGARPGIGAAAARCGGADGRGGADRRRSGPGPAVDRRRHAIRRRGPEP